MSTAFFFKDTATTDIYTLSLHDALPIYPAHAQPSRPASRAPRSDGLMRCVGPTSPATASRVLDRKSTRLNSSHANISYAVFCLKQKRENRHQRPLLHEMSV